MKIIAKRDPIANVQKNFLAKLQEVLLENLPIGRGDVTTIEACLATYVKHEEKIQSITTASANLENFKKIHDAIKEM
jgi:hypothetical protein